MAVVEMYYMVPLSLPYGVEDRLTQVVEQRNRTSLVFECLYLAKLYLCLSFQCEARCLFLVQSHTIVFLHSTVESVPGNSSHYFFSVQMNHLYYFFPNRNLIFWMLPSKSDFVLRMGF